MKNKDLRDVSFTNRPFGKTKGKFHLWASKAYLNDDGKDFGITVALIELEDGSIIEVEPGNIMFLN